LPDEAVPKCQILELPRITTLPNISLLYTFYRPERLLVAHVARIGMIEARIPGEESRETGFLWENTGIRARSAFFKTTILKSSLSRGLCFLSKNFQKLLTFLSNDGINPLEGRA
jgi:hypothetical protein